jgi:hypothetical protein
MERKPTEHKKQQRVHYADSINKIASAANVELPEATIVVYLERLLQLTPEQLAEATRRTIEEWDRPSMMPPLKFILDRAGNNPKLEAEKAWERWERLSGAWYPDGLGWQNGVDKELTPAMQYAIRQCGGEHRMIYCSEESFPFIRRQFLESHERFQVEGGAQQLTTGEAKNLLNFLYGKKEIPEKGDA